MHFHWSIFIFTLMIFCSQAPVWCNATLTADCVFKTIHNEKNWANICRTMCLMLNLQCNIVPWAFRHMYYSILSFFPMINSENTLVRMFSIHPLIYKLIYFSSIQHLEAVLNLSTHMFFMYFTSSVFFKLPLFSQSTSRLHICLSASLLASVMTIPLTCQCISTGDDRINESSQSFEGTDIFIHLVVYLMLKSAFEYTIQNCVPPFYTSDR